MRFKTRGLTVLVVVIAMVSATGVVLASSGSKIRGGNGNDSLVNCRGGMAVHGQVLSEDSPVFPGDPQTMIETFEFFDDEGFFSFKVEEVSLASHTGTHLDAPAHFIEGGRSVDQLEAEDVVWPAYVIDVRDRIASDGPDFELTLADIQQYEDLVGEIENGSMVIIQTGNEGLFVSDPDAYANAVVPGFSADAVQWMVDERNVGGIGSDTFGPDATGDETFGATFTILANDRVALPNLTNLDALARKGDILMAPTVRLANGSGFQTNPISCLSR